MSTSWHIRVNGALGVNGELGSTVSAVWGVTQPTLKETTTSGKLTALWTLLTVLIHLH